MVTFVGNKNQHSNITLKKKKKRKNASRRIRLKPPVMITLKSSEPTSLLHYHFLAGFRNPFNLNVPAQNQPANPDVPDMNIEHLVDVPQEHLADVGPTRTLLKELSLQ